jgi:ABC-type Co2+ transport system permease subunit
MHVPDGFLAPYVTIPAYAAAAPLLAVAARRRFGAGAREALPLLGSLTAVAFVLQTVRIPVPGGTSTHLAGTALLDEATANLDPAASGLLVESGLAHRHLHRHGGEAHAHYHVHDSE